jgi:hypothetical protein
MANSTVTVRVSGGTPIYTSLNAALSGQSIDHPNLTTDCNGTGSAGILTISCSDGTAADTTQAATGTGFTTSTNYYINIVGDANSGVWDTSKYQLEVNGTAFLAREDGCIINSLQISITNANFAYGVDLSIPGIHGGTKVTNCIIRKNGTGLRCAGILLFVYNGDSEIYNNIIYDFDDNDTNTNGQYGIDAGGSTAVWGKIYNNTLYNCRVGIATAADSANVVVENNLVMGIPASSSGFTWPGTTTNIVSNNNGSADATADDAGGTNHHVSISTTEFLNAGSKDFRLASTATSIDNGKSESGVFTTDITGVDRSGTWDIGAFEYVAAATGTNYDGTSASGLMGAAGAKLFGV